ncbi:protein rapunzel-like [Oryzias melastigma]|uniref:Rapunzel 4 n=1 Tax=Oryzias melastigma TaxID=30732 RepID=A0A3B3CR19_ORYME|nr:protein rapunzel-like [Oryzias melastigma]
MEDLKTFVAERKDMVESVMSAFEFGAEMAASIAGDIFPIVSLAAPLVQLALDNVEDKETVFMREQFQKVKTNLEKASEGVQRINEEFKKANKNIQLFPIEKNIKHQFRRYMLFLSDNSDYNKKEFLQNFDSSGGKKPLKDLYGIVIGTPLFGKPLLNVILTYEEKSRRPVEEYCAQLKYLFCMGITTLLAHDALTGSAKEKRHLEKWRQKMTTVQDNINAAIEECIDSFPIQAKTDCHRLVRDREGLTKQELADALIEMLKERYDWVGWSVRVCKSHSSIFCSKKECECPTGQSRFKVTTTDEEVYIWVSYSTYLKPLDKKLIQDFIQSQKTPTVDDIAEHLFEKLQGYYMVQIVKSCKHLVCSSSFADDCHYWEKHANVYVCVHSF